MNIWLVCRVVMVSAGLLYVGLIGFFLVRCEVWDVCVGTWTMVERPDGWHRERVLPEVESVKLRDLVIGPYVEIDGDIVWLDEAYEGGFLPLYEDVEFEDLGFVPVLEVEGETDRLEGVYEDVEFEDLGFEPVLEVEGGTDRLEAVYEEGFLPEEAGP